MILGFCTYRLFFLSGPDRDFMAIVMQPAPNAPWEASARFRYYVDNKAHDSADEKQFYGVKGHGNTDQDRDDLCAVMLASVQLLKQEGFGSFLDVINIPAPGDTVAFMKVASTRPYMHVKQEDTAEA